MKTGAPHRDAADPAPPVRRRALREARKRLGVAISPVRRHAPGEARSASGAPPSTIAPMRRSSSPSEFDQPTLSESDGVRYLHFNTEWVQGAMRVKNPAELVLEYTGQMMAWLLFLEPPKEEAIGMLGLGAGSLARFCAKHAQPAAGGGMEPGRHRRRPHVLPPARPEPAAGRACRRRRLGGRSAERRALPGADGGPVRRPGPGAGARQRQVLPRLPACAGRGRRAGGQPVRSPRASARTSTTCPRPSTTA